MAFDLANFKVGGPRVPVVQDSTTSHVTLSPQFALALDGSLAYIPIIASGKLEPHTHRVVLVSPQSDQFRELVLLNEQMTTGEEGLLSADRGMGEGCQEDEGKSENETEVFNEVHGSS